MGTTWEGWRDAKDSPGDPEWWYEVRRFDEDGNDLTGTWSFGGTLRYRRLSDAVIAEKTKDRALAEAQASMRYEHLPVITEKQTCRKCGGMHVKLRHCSPLSGNSASHFGERSVLTVLCKRCDFVWYAKPLDHAEDA